MKRFTLNSIHLIIIFLFAVAGHTQYVKSEIGASDLVITAEVIHVSDGEQGYTYRSDTPDDRSPLFDVLEVRLRVLSTVLGEPQQEITVALPKGWCWHEGEMPIMRRWRYDVRPGQRALWFLQRSGDGHFTEETRSTTSIVEYMWCAPNNAYSLAALRGGTAVWLPVAITSFDPNNGTMLRLADLFAANAAADPDGRQHWLWLLHDISPVPIKSVGYGDNLEGAELQRYMNWLNNRFPELFPTSEPAARLSALALRMSWGQEERSDEFIDLLIELGADKLEGRFPPLYRFSDSIRLIPHVNKDTARLVIRGLKTARSDRAQITVLALARFDEDHYLDVAILETLAHLWSRPDLSPIGPGGVLDDVSEQKALARLLPGG